DGIRDYKVTGVQTCALPICGAQRNPALPDVPTFDELLPGMVSATWFALLAPPKTPSEIVAKLNAAIVEALRQPEVQRRLAEMHRSEERRVGKEGRSRWWREQ